MAARKKKEAVPDERCPNCGYCAHCGQSRQAAPVLPWVQPYPWYQPYRVTPWWDTTAPPVITYVSGSVVAGMTEQ